MRWAQLKKALCRGLSPCSFNTLQQLGISGVEPVFFVSIDHWGDLSKCSLQCSRPRKAGFQVFSEPPSMHLSEHHRRGAALGHSHKGIMSEYQVHTRYLLTGGPQVSLHVISSTCTTQSWNKLTAHFDGFLYLLTPLWIPTWLRVIAETGPTTLLQLDLEILFSTLGSSQACPFQRQCQYVTDAI